MAQIWAVLASAVGVVVVVDLAGLTCGTEEEQGSHDGWFNRSVSNWVRGER